MNHRFASTVAVTALLTTISVRADTPAPDAIDPATLAALARVRSAARARQQVPCSEVTCPARPRAAARYNREMAI